MDLCDGTSKLTWLWIIIFRCIPTLNNLRQFAEICQQPFLHYLNQLHMNLISVNLVILHLGRVFEKQTHPKQSISIVAWCSNNRIQILYHKLLSRHWHQTLLHIQLIRLSIFLNYTPCLRSTDMDTAQKRQHVILKKYRIQERVCVYIYSMSCIQML